MNINFSPINLINNVSLRKVPSFKRADSSPCDEFIRNKDNSLTKVDNGRGGIITGKIVKDVTFSDRTGKKVSGFILEDSKVENQYYAVANGRNQCRMLLKDDADSVCISQLYGHNNRGEVKGAGTELIKFAIEKSKEKGFNGKLSLAMTGSFPFYYKNNFRINPENNKNADVQNAAIDYITRTGVETSATWFDYWSTPVVELSPENAEKLLNGERNIDKSKSDTLYSVEYKGGRRVYNAKMDFADLDDRFVLQMMVRDKQYATLTGKIENGNLIPEGNIESDFFFHYPRELDEEFRRGLSVAQEKYSDKKTG